MYLEQHQSTSLPAVRFADAAVACALPRRLHSLSNQAICTHSILRNGLNIVLVTVIIQIRRILFDNRLERWIRSSRLIL